VSAGDLFYDRYTTTGTEEWLLRIGPAEGPLLLFLPPLFEELNRTRAMLVRTMRALASRGWTCLLPDLPGTGESLRPLETVDWTAWRAAAADAAPGALAGTVAVRGGCLLDDAAGGPCAWRLSPVDGAVLLRDLARTGLIDDAATGGYAPGADLSEPLSGASPASTARVRTVRLASDPAEAARKLDAPPIWRRAEPQTGSALADVIAGDIDLWVRACAGS